MQALTLHTEDSVSHPSAENPHERRECSFLSPMVPHLSETEQALAYLDTHYYGGIKKYQWAAIPLALHGTVAKKDGTTVDITIGEKEDDPVLVISDLLIHLAGEQMEKKASVVISTVVPSFFATVPCSASGMAAH